MAGSNSAESQVAVQLSDIGALLLERVEQLADETLFYWVYAEHECNTQETCDLARKTVFLKLFTCEDPCPDISISVSKWDVKWEKDLCKHCQVACARLHKEGSYVKWSQLPEMFDLPDWDDLTGE